MRLPASLTGRVKRGLLKSGHYARRLRRARFPGVAVLCYHGIAEQARDNTPLGALHVGAADFEGHCRLLRETCDPIRLDDWREALAGGRPLPPRPVLVSFDDGYRSVWTRAQPSLARHGIPSVVFACSEPIATRSLLWFDALARVSGAAGVEAAKALGFAAWRRQVDATTASEASAPESAPMSVAELRQLAAAPGVEIGGHTASHLILARAGLEVQEAEIAGNRKQLEAWTGQAVRAFAYPNGRPGVDYTAETVALVAAQGFDMAFTTRPGFAHPGEPALERSRFLMLASVSAAELAHRLSYSWHSPRASAS